MVCGRCGRPLGIGSQPRQLRRLTLTSAGRVWRWLTILLLLSALYGRRLPSRVGYPQEEVFL